MSSHISAYNLITNTFNNNYSYSVAITKNVTKTDNNAKTVSEELESFQKAVKKLSGYDASTTLSSRLEERTKKFIEKYNELAGDKDSYSNKTYQKYMDKLDTLLTENKSELRKAGIVFNDDGELEFNSEKFEKASKKDFEKIYSGKDSFITQAQTYIKKASEIATNNIVNYEKASNNVMLTLDEAKFKTGFYAYRLDNTAALIGLVMDNPESYSADDLNQYLDDYAKEYEYLKENIDSDNISKFNGIIDLQNQDDIANAFVTIGFSYDADGNFSYTGDSSTVAETDALNAIYEVFANNSSFRTDLSDLCGQIFKKSFGTENIGLTVDEYI